MTHLYVYTHALFQITKHFIDTLPGNPIDQTLPRMRLGLGTRDYVGQGSLLAKNRYQISIPAGSSAYTRSQVAVRAMSGRDLHGRQAPHWPVLLMASSGTYMYSRPKRCAMNLSLLI